MEEFEFQVSEVDKSLVTIRMVFGPKRRRTSSYDRREDGVSYLDMVSKGAVDPNK